MQLKKYKDYLREGVLPMVPDEDCLGKVVEACADAYGYLAGIDATQLGLADDALSDRVALAMDSIVVALAYVKIDIREYRIK